MQTSYLESQSPSWPHPGTTATEPSLAFRRSMLISALRCTLTYLVLPFVVPLVDLSTGISSGLGLLLGPLAIAANLYSIRRFWSANHKYKLHASAVHVAMILALTALLVGDVTTTFS